MEQLLKFARLRDNYTTWAFLLKYSPATQATQLLTSIKINVDQIMKKDGNGPTQHKVGGWSPFPCAFGYHIN